MFNTVEKLNGDVVVLKDMQQIYLDARREQENELLSLDYAYSAWLDSLDVQEDMHYAGC